MSMKTAQQRLSILVGIAVIIVLAVGCWFYRAQEYQVRHDAVTLLQATAQLKVDEITNWRNERMADAYVLRESPIFVDGVSRYLRTQQREDAASLLSRFRAVRDYEHYADVMLVDAAGRARLRLAAENDPPRTEVLQGIAQARREHRPVLTDLHRAPHDATPQMDVVTPLFTRHGASEAYVGALVLNIDATKYLYPLLQSWPTPSRSAETLLVHREDDTVLILNTLRFQRGAAFNMRIPLTRTTTPAVMAVLGHTGAVQGKDYRGVAVVAVLRSIPDSPWFMVTKADTAEIFAEWRFRAGLILTLILGVFALLGMIAFSFRQHSRRAHFQALYASEAALRASEERFGITLKSIGDAVIATDTQGRVDLLNPVAAALTGWTNDEAHGKPLDQVFRIVNEASRKIVENPVTRVLREGVVVGLANHTVLIAKDGAEYPIADSGSPIRDAQGEITGVVLVFRDVTAEHHYQQALYESEELYHSLFTNMHNGFAYCRMLYDNDGRPDDFIYLDVNPAFETQTQLLGVVGKRASEAIPGIREADPELINIYGRVAATGIPATFEMYVAAMSMWFSISVYRPRADHFVAVFDVITERKRREAEIQRLNRLYAVLSQVNQAVVRATDPLKLLEVACRAVVTEGGFKVGWIGRMDSDTQYVHTMAACGDAIEYVYGISVSLDDRPEGRGPVGTAIREGRASICNDLFVDPHTEPWRERASRHGLHEMAAFPIRMHGEVWGALALYAGEFGYFGDKEMALLEEAAADIGFALDNLANTAQRQRIEAENDRLAAAIAQAAEIVMITDPEGIIQYVNPAFEKVTGYTRDEARGQNPRLLKSGQQDAAFYRTLWETLVSGHIWEGRFVNKKKDGACYTEEATISPVRDNAGVIVNYVAVKRDITHELNLENQFIHAQKMEVVGRLAGGIAHDFNNILTGVLGFTDLLLESTPDDTLAHADLQEIRRLGQRAADLTRQLLAFSRRQALVMETVDLNALVENTLKMLTRILGEDITLRHELAFGLGTVKADAGQLEQVILNLALNARDAMPHGGVLTIEVADVAFSPEATHLHLGVEFGAYVMLRMTDTGVGMTHDVLAQIFEPFFTTKSVGQGTGLGMATVYGIVKQHGGNIFVSSEPGAGTTCKIYLPRIEEAPVISQSLPIAPKSGDETILLVEDEETVRVVVESMLSMMGYTVCTAEDGAEAERLFREDPARFALLLTDIVMPGINGRELSCRLLAVKPDLKVLFMSGYTANAIVHRGMLDAGVVLLQKPFTMELLGRKVREVLDS